MNIFILCAGRCGSHTITAACRHVTNYTAGHETRSRKVGDDRLAYPPNHIEADNRLTWVLGRLDQAYGPSAYYVHLTRDPAAHAASFARNMGWPGSISRAWRDAVLQGDRRVRDIEACRDYVEASNENIRLFLKDKPHWMPFQMENWREDFPRFWQWVGAKGDQDAAMREWLIKHNETPQKRQRYFRNLRLLYARLLTARR